jgi:hypothetical protein
MLDIAAYNRITSTFLKVVNGAGYDDEGLA